MVRVISEGRLLSLRGIEWAILIAGGVICFLILMIEAPHRS